MLVDRNSEVLIRIGTFDYLIVAAHVQVWLMNRDVQGFDTGLSMCSP